MMSKYKITNKNLKTYNHIRPLYAIPVYLIFLPVVLVYVLDQVSELVIRKIVEPIIHNLTCWTVYIIDMMWNNV